VEHTPHTTPLVGSQTSLSVEGDQVVYGWLEEVSGGRPAGEFEGLVVDVATVYGRTVTVLADHEMPVLAGDRRIESRRASQLVPGDLVLLRRQVARPRYEVTRLNVPAALRAAGRGETLRARGEQVEQAVLEQMRRENPAKFAQRVSLARDGWAELVTMRKELGITGGQMATRCGMKQAASISEYETCRRGPTVDVFSRYLDALGAQWPPGAEVVDGPWGGSSSPADSANARYRRAGTDAWLRDLDGSVLDGLTDALLYPTRYRELTFPTTLAVDEHLGLILGWHAAEGSLNAGRVRFALGTDDQHYIDELADALVHVSGRRPQLYEDPVRPNSWELYVDHLVLAELFRALGCQGPAPVKRVPALVFNAPREVQLAFLRGLFLGDGCKGASSVGQVDFSTTSEELAYGTAALLGQVGVFASVYRSVAKRVVVPQGTVYEDHERWDVHVYWTEGLEELKSLWRSTPLEDEWLAAIGTRPWRARDLALLDAHTAAVPIRSVRARQYCGPVVHAPDDGSLQSVNGIVVHHRVDSRARASSMGTVMVDG